MNPNPITTESIDMSTRTTSQRDVIKAALLRGESLNPMKALRRFGCMRLASRISELRCEEGMQISTTMIEAPSGARYASYAAHTHAVPTS
jgi:hypothetical protein